MEKSPSSNHTRSISLSILHSRRGLLYYQSADYLNAERDYDEAIQQLIKQGRKHEARKFIRKDLVEKYQRRAEARVKLGKCDPALKDFSEANSYMHSDYLTRDWALFRTQLQKARRGV